MTGDPRRPGRLEPIDDAAIEQLVRDAAEGWAMPPVRLDAPSWRDRVRSPRARRIEAARGWLGRVGQAATAAVALTIVGALAAVLITRPPNGPGDSGGPSGAPGSPNPSGAVFTPLPKLFLDDGVLPVPSTVLVQTERGDFALVDLETGMANGDLTGAAYGSAVQRRSDGTYICLCVRLSGSFNGSATHADVTLERFDRSGKHTSTVPIATLDGEPDPRDGAIPERPPHLAFATSFSEGAAFGFIGWSVRAHPIWRSGIIVIDLAAGREVSRLELPDGTTGEGDTRRVVFAPRVAGSAIGTGLAIARESYQWSPPESLGANFQQALEVFRADFPGGVVANLTTVDAAGCGQRVLRTGATADGWWVACQRYSNSDVVVRRFDAADVRLGDTTIPAGLGIDGDVTALSDDRRALFVWNPRSAVLTRVDLSSGTTSEGRGPTAIADPGPLTALGEWLAPAAAAKTFLAGGIVVSPDGSRVYTAGIDQDAAMDEMAGSSGIFVFDAASLESLDRWEPTADFVSLAVSPDGRHVYAAGLPGFDAGGTQRPTQQASITVFDAADGTVTLLAGQLGRDLLTFVTPTLD